ncbi:MAG TPA: UDP-N-acetylmuramate--L-alanine ligase [Thermoanaerobaculia bacterium]|nr:UDP-N-acetylmuramate--L-alanine ligase [Thermoanaerobaculia bacterium]
MDFGRIQNIHFIGIGGIGMSGIAEVLSNYPLQLSGCDLVASPITERLAARGIRVIRGHHPDHVAEADLVVVSSAIRQSSPEVLRARELKRPVIRRAEMLGEITRLKKGIAIAGTHGKTTTSAMTATVLVEAGLDPTLIIGGVLREIATSARLGSSDYLVVEADEYDRSFLTLHPTISVITNIEADHLDCYRDLDDIRDTFGEFARKVPFYGTVIGCSDDPEVAGLLESIEKRTLSYGVGEGARLRAVDLAFDQSGSSFRVVFDGEDLGRATLRVPGAHNVRNALAATAVGLEIGIPFETISAALAGFEGVERRFQILGESDGALIVDDYAHHPTEVRSTIEAARGGYPGRRVVALFQPHLFSRTRDFAAEFGQALATADLALVAPIYPAREEPIEGVSSALIVDAAHRAGGTNVTLVDRDCAGLVASVREILRENDLFLTMGAGDIHRVGAMLTGAES